MPFVVREGDPTTTGGFVLSASATELIDERRVARMGDPVWCPACKSVGYIAQGNPTYINDCVAVATHGHEVKCGCQPGNNRLTASQKHSRADMEASISIPAEMAEKAQMNVEQIIGSIKAGTFASPLFKPDAQS
ncbi:PAAR domain-containing protein [Pseudomonas capsici]|uniref:PAAR domain-containing protein n=1 Tax=Pseudomonas capsici TaxID=2810614 RepID=A0ABT3BVA9_9PSED|nr:PAAR domain-containing protein [Pseudomonas capsici]MBX8475020.1 PAAR domain-containing protein [Pseudomonas cichorii]MBN6713733.1 PAAR domain-containing protein [Pseudomonas capsici]MBN6719044.1 PAAR domain-containing protein [Pseudomonas capsici]MBN6723833.1 PAAR domain-containing protein [Pseudomonas capsici]MBX8608031.1 PAAR domain-containing protein [Pseudomonas cichorii]